MKTVYVSLSFLSLPCDRFSLVKRPTTRYEDRSSRSHNRSNRRLSRPPSSFSSLPSFFLPLSKNLPRSESRTLCSTSPRRPKKGGREGGKKNETSGKHGSEICSPRKMALRTSLFQVFHEISDLFLRSRLDCLPLSFLFFLFRRVIQTKLPGGREVDNHRFAFCSRRDTNIFSL